MILEELLDSLEAERIKILFSSQNSKIRGLETSFFALRVPLESTYAKEEIKCISVKPIVGSSDKILVALLWEACFGRKFKVIHWFILFNVLIKTLRKDRSSEVLLALLVIITARAGTCKWNSNMKPLKTILFEAYGQERGDGIMNIFLENLPLQLPKRRPAIESCLAIEFDGKFSQRYPKPVPYIGVGYKDKGSLRQSQGISPLESEFIAEKDHVYEILLRQVKDKFKDIINLK